MSKHIYPNAVYCPHEKSGEYTKRKKYPKKGIIIHTTGSGYLKKHKSYLDGFNYLCAYYQGNFTSHFLIAVDGTIAQFLPADSYAPHCGMASRAWNLYAQGFDVWSRWKYDTLGKLKGAKSWIGKGDGWYLRRDGRADDAYDVWKSRWIKGEDKFEFDRKPNSTFIGIDFQGLKQSESHYFDEQYASLCELVSWLDASDLLPSREEMLLVGHEDMNPLTRHNWDPGSKFDWKKASECLNCLRSDFSPDDEISGLNAPKIGENRASEFFKKVLRIK